MEDKHNKLDTFLRSQLNNTAEDPSWNVPDDQIFESAMRTVAAEKKKKRRTWIIIPFILLAGWLGMEYIHSNQMNPTHGNDAALNTTTTLHHLPANQIAKNAPGIDVENSTLSELAAANAAITDEDITAETGAHQKVFPIHPTGAALKKSSSNSPVTSHNMAQVSTVVSQSFTELPAGIYKAASLHSDSHETGSASKPSPYRWVSSPIASLAIHAMQGEEAAEKRIDMPEPAGKPLTNVNPPLPWRLGILLGANQSWLTMKKITVVPDARLYAYENFQSGAGISGFIQKPLTSRFSLQSDFGYHAFKNRSILENRFYFDTDNVVETSTGKPVYQADMDLMNPMGDYNAMIEFRVNDQMQENDLMQEITNNKQILHSINLGLSLQYAVLKAKHFDVSIGTGLSLHYRSGLQNEFRVSIFHDDILQSNQTVLPNQLQNVRRWFLQGIGRLNVEYHLSHRIGIIIETQYTTGLTSMRKGVTANGPQTYLHALMMSAGFTHSF